MKAQTCAEEGIRVPWGRGTGGDRGPGGNHGHIAENWVRCSSVSSGLQSKEISAPAFAA